MVEQLHRQHLEASLAERWEQLAATTPVHVGRTTMHRALKQLGLMCKKTSHAAEQDTEAGRQVRAAYWEFIGQQAGQPLIFVDETGSHIDLARSYAWAPRDQRAYAA